MIFSPVKVNDSFTVDVICEFDMRVFPFDTQRCQVVFALKGNSNYFVKLLQDKVTYSGSENIMQYVVHKVDFILNVSVK